MRAKFLMYTAPCGWKSPTCTHIDTHTSDTWMYPYLTSPHTCHRQMVTPNWVDTILSPLPCEKAIPKWHWRQVCKLLFCYWCRCFSTVVWGLLQLSRALFRSCLFSSFDWALTQRVPPFQAMLYRDDSLPAANLPAPAAPGVSPVSFVLNMGGVLRI